MNAERHQRIKEIFGELCDLPHAVRSVRLDAISRDDPALALDVETLLKHSDTPAFELDDAGQFSSLISDIGSGPILDVPRPLRLGMYDIIDQIGQGGMGVVYLARQQKPLQRDVAIKVIRPGMDSRQVLARFDIERRTLAAMNHPYIASIHDAGMTDEGRPYFVMQHVGGTRMTTYCDDRKLSIAQRLALFLRVCEAVIHAHQKGVIHRDLKPSNILIEEQDGVPVPRVIDFGVAKAMSESLDEETLHTAPGQLIGTPQYMSPEQTELGGMHVDTRSDVYSLGVLLYELLCGSTPIDAATIRSASFDAVCTMIREQDLTVPSRRMAQLEAAEAQRVAHCRSVSRHDLMRELRGELDWITRTALEKDPARRYASVAALAADIMHHQRHEPVTAGPMGTVYRLRKFARRHRGAMLATCAIALALVGGAAAVTWQSLKTAREADNNWEIVRFMEDMLKSADPVNARGQDTTLREFMDHASERLWKETELPGDVRASLHNSIGSTYASLGDYDSAGRHFEASRDLSLRLHGPLDQRTLRSIGNLVQAYHLQERDEEAYALGRENLSRAEASLGPFATETRLLTTNLALVADALGHAEEAERLYQLTVERCRETAETAPDYYQGALTNLGVFLMNRGELKRGAAVLEESATIARRLYGEDHPTTLTVHTNRAALLQRQGDPEAARVILVDLVERSRHVLGPLHPLTLLRVRNLCITTMQVGKVSDAEAMLRLIVADAIAQYGHAHSETIGLVELLVTAIALQDRIEEAVNYSLEEYALVVAEVGEEHPRARRSAKLVAESYDSWQKPDLYREWLARAGESPK